MRRDHIAVFTTIAVIVVLLVLLSRPFAHPRTSGEPVPQESTTAQTQVEQASLAPESIPANPEVVVVYLFDISRSMNTGGKDSPFARSVHLLKPLIAGLSSDDGLDRPQLHRIGIIGNASLGQEPVCELPVGSSTVFTKPDPGGLQNRIADCEARLSRLTPSTYTDIAGALKYAGLALQGFEHSQRVVILLSDLEEDLPKTSEAGVADLHGICVAAFYQITGNTPTTPQMLDQRIAMWSKRLDSWGARATLFRHTDAFSPSDLVRFVRGCQKS